MSEGIWVAIITPVAGALVILVNKLINRRPERVSRLDKVEADLISLRQKYEDDIGDLRQKLFIAVRFIYQQERHAILHDLPPLPIPDELQGIL